jgi:hypothetical protein
MKEWEIEAAREDSRRVSARAVVVKMTTASQKRQCTEEGEARPGKTYDTVKEVFAIDGAGKASACEFPGHLERRTRWPG